MGLRRILSCEVVSDIIMYVRLSALPLSLPSFLFLGIPVLKNVSRDSPAAWPIGKFRK